MLRYEQTGSLQGGIIRFDKSFRFFLAKGKMCKSTHFFLDVFNERTDFHKHVNSQFNVLMVNPHFKYV